MSKNRNKNNTVSYTHNSSDGVLIDQISQTTGIEQRDVLKDQY
jgi:hypothetical protein